MTSRKQNEGRGNSFLSAAWKRVSSLSFGRLALSLFLASFMWLNANYESDLEKNVEIPINYLNLPKGLIISNRPYLPVNAKLRIKGTRSQVSAVLKTNTAINMDLGNERTGISTRPISAESVSLPRNVQIVRMSPREIVLDIDTVLEKFVSVKPDIGQPEAGYRMEGEARVNPSTARIKGPKKVIQDISEVITSPVSIEKERSTFSVEVGLVSPDSRVEFSETKTVKVTVNIVELEVEKTFQSLEVEMLNVPKAGTYKIEPQRADIRFHGPRSLINSLHSEDIKIYADLQSAEELTEDSPTPVKLGYSYPQSDKIQVTKITPEKVKVKKERTEK